MGPQQTSAIREKLRFGTNALKNLNETILRNNLKEWAEEKYSCTRNHMLMSSNNFREASLSYGLPKLKKNEQINQLSNNEKSINNNNVYVNDKEYFQTEQCTMLY